VPNICATSQAPLLFTDFICVHFVAACWNVTPFRVQLKTLLSLTHYNVDSSSDVSSNITWQFVFTVNITCVSFLFLSTRLLYLYYIWLTVPSHTNFKSRQIVDTARSLFSCTTYTPIRVFLFIRLERAISNYGIRLRTVSPKKASLDPTQGCVVTLYTLFRMFR
jgi:hypothetical protein